MTFAKHMVRSAALGALVLGLTVSSVEAQNGTNWHVLSNGIDAAYGGLGAGGTQQLGDGIGSWVDGNDLRGNHVTGLGEFGYRQVAFFTSECVLGAPPAVSLNFPAIVFIEFGGRNNNRQDIFIRPTCVAGIPAGTTSGGALPYGLSPGASANFLISGLPTGVGFPSSTTILLPNNGLLPASNGGTATIIAAASANLPINSTGFCWAVRFTWTPSALLSLDHVDGWWFWQENSVNGNQYWAASNDEGNSFTSNSIATDAGQSALIAFFGSTELEWHQLSRDPSLNHTIAPVGFNGSGVYYATTSFGAIGPFNINGGGDLGRHGGISVDGLGGVKNPNTLLGTQDPAGAAIAGLVPTHGFVSWDNDTTLTGSANFRTIFTQIDWAGVLGTNPATRPNALVGPPGSRLPISVVNPPGPGPWPQPITLQLLTLWIHNPATKVDVDPLGFPGGAFGIPPVWTATRQLVTTTLSPVCSIGLRVAIDQGSVGLIGPPFSDFNFDPGSQRISVSSSVQAID